MDFRRLHPDPAVLDSGELLGDLGLVARAHDDRPWLVTNFATTADGRATINGRSGPIGDDGDMEVFRRLRTQVDALLIGTRTLAIERYGRAVRRPELRAAREALGLAPEPVVATVSGSGALPTEIPLFEEPGAHVVAFVPPDAPEPARAAVRGRPDADGRAAARGARGRAVRHARAAARGRRRWPDDQQRPRARRP